MQPLREQTPNLQQEFADLTAETIRLRRQHLRLRNDPTVPHERLLAHARELRCHVRALRDHMGRRLDLSAEPEIKD